MDKVNWTLEQQDAIYEKDANILVAAAAGSGKTAVLVERIITKIIEDKVDVDQLLVVTFTNSAASEMRERVLNAIYKKLEENPEDENLQRQITLLNKASICTIDSFCLEVVRNNFYELENISPNFRIADTTEIELLKQEVIEDIFEEKYETEDSDFTKLINVYTSYRDDTPLKELVLKIDSYIQSNPFPQKWLAEKIEMFNLRDKQEKDFSQTPWGKILLKVVEEELMDAIATLKKVEEDLSKEVDLEEFYQIIRSDIEQLENLKEHLKNWDEAYEIAENLKFVTWSKKKVESEIKDNAKIIRDAVKKKLGTVLNKTLIWNSQEANQDIYEMYEILLKLQNLILTFEKEFARRKREKNVVDFSDVEHFALEILRNTKEVAEKYKNKFAEIAIDEYQDSNLVQEYILTSIARGNNIFMVGDVKQSIYKFRQAMPELFLTKYENYQKKGNKKPEDDLKIQLFKNFRSKEKILQFTNLIFENIMGKTLGDIDYNQEEFLNLGASYPEISQNEKIEIHIIDPKLEKEEEAFEQREETEEEASEEIIPTEEEKIEDVELEAKFVANQIKKLVENKYQVWDKKQESYRDIQYKDIVILLRSTKTTAPIYEQEILKLQMPVFSDSSQEYLDSIEIQTMMSLLKIIDNPIQDIPLVAVMRSNIGKFTDDELIQIRLADRQDNFYTCLQKAKLSVEKELQQKIETFLENLTKWRKEQEYLALDELVWKIYSDTGYYNYVGLMPNGKMKQANLRMLFERAKQYETASFKGLFNFIHFVEKLRISSGDMGAAKIIGENDDVIRIMSIHKSKGLEFPVVFLASTGKQFNLMDLNQNILLHQDLGIGVKYIDYEKQVQYDTLSKEAIRNQTLTEILSEEMRILYVALTRAKEKLIITGMKKDYEKEKEKLVTLIERYQKHNAKINPILIKKYVKYIDWILLVYFYEQTKIKEIASLNTYTKNEVLDFCQKIEKEEIDIVKKLEQEKIKEEQLKEITDILNSKYKYELSTKIPTKSSVTKIKQGMQEKVDLNFGIPKFLKTEENVTLTGSQKGILLHLCMQKLEINQKYNLEAIQEFIQNLVKKEIITPVEAKGINPKAILKFTQSNIWQEMKEAKEIQREKPFYITIPAKEIYQAEASEEILVQGVIDLFFRNKKDEIVLVDYKTDFVQTEEELIEKYQKQLELYQKALEEALQEKVSRVLIYSTYLGKELEVLKK